jgi:exodeoxyribonuclease VII small subunit
MAKKKAAAKSKQQQTSNDLDFEQSLREVEEIVSRLEGGQLGLSESLEQYEVGIRRLKRCHELLDAAEQRVSVLAGFDAEGNPVEEPLQEASEGRKANTVSSRSTAPDPRQTRETASESEEEDEQDSGSGGGLF